MPSKVSFAISYPDLSQEIHPTKNTGINPNNYSKGSHKKIWWKCSVADDHEWESTIYNRTSGQKCPFCSGQRVAKSNSLASTYSWLASEWHDQKNFPLTPELITAGSGKKVWWKCPKGDDHIWCSPVFQRTNVGHGCPACAGRLVVKSNSLSTTHPDIAGQWYRPNNGRITPDDISAGSDRKFWWICNKGSDHIWEASVSGRTHGSGCPICSNNLLVNSNSLATLYPNLASEWHSTENGTLQPSDVHSHSNRKVWWQCKVNPKHEWQAHINNRHRAGCPYCRGLGGSKYEIRIYSELLTIFPDIKFHAKIHGKELDVYIPSQSLGIEYDGRYWHQKRRGADITKNKFLVKKGVKVIRIRESGLNLTGPNDIVFDTRSSDLDLIQSLVAKIKSVLPKDTVTQSKLSSYLSKSKLQNKKYTEFLVNWFPKPIPGTSLQDKYTEIASEWHPSKNSYLKASDVFPHAGIKVWWKCGQGHEWETTVDHRTRKDGTRCPECSPKTRRVRIIAKENLFSTRHPELVSEWHSVKNGELNPATVGHGSARRVWWQCANGHEWIDRINRRSAGSTCPKCRKEKDKGRS